jgi:nucleotide-binding universal stress UspA family protein
MYKRIILAVDLAEPSPAPKGLPQALELAKFGGGELRLVNVQPVVPATFMEYIPPDFDAEQTKRAMRRWTLSSQTSTSRPNARAPPRGPAGSTTSFCRRLRNGTPT